MGLENPHWSLGLPLQSSITGLGGFSPGSFQIPLQQISRSAELASKERGNCNNVIFGAESYQSRNHVTTIIQDFLV